MQLLTETPLDQELLVVALHLWMTRASDVWCLLVPGHSPALSSSTWRFSAIDSMTLIFWLLQSSGTSGCVVVVVGVVVVGAADKYTSDFCTYLACETLKNKTNKQINNNLLPG